MPELPEVEVVRRILESYLLDGVIGTVLVYRMDMVRNADRNILDKLEGQRIQDIRRHGKMLIVELFSSWRLIFHLKMTGILAVGAPGEPGKHCHVIIRGISKDGGTFNLYFHDSRRFGYVYVQRDADDPSGPLHRSLGPDALDISPGDLERIIASSGRRIKALLLDQTKLAGLGNIYTDEILFKTGIHPMISAKDLSKEAIFRLHANMVHMLEKAIEKGGSSVRDFIHPSGEKGSFQMEHSVYRRQGRKCVCCNDAIVRIVVAGRGTYLCPSCQEYQVSSQKGSRCHHDKN